MGFNYGFRPLEEVEFALSFPWTYSQDRDYYSRLVERYRGSDRIEVEKEVLCTSNLGHDVDMITITDRRKEVQEESKASDTEQEE